MNVKPRKRTNVRWVIDEWMTKCCGFRIHRQLDGTLSCFACGREVIEPTGGWQAPEVEG